MKPLQSRTFAILALVFCAFFLGMIVIRPVESAGRYEYRVVSITGMTQLRTQSDAEQGRMKAIESVLNEQAAQGWQFDQADGYILYFHRQKTSN